MVKITYGTGYLDDFSALPPTGNSSADPLTGLVEEIQWDDWMRLYGVPNSVDNEWRNRRTVDLTSLGLSSTIYNKWRTRICTEASTPGLAISIIIEYTDAETEIVLPVTFTDNWWKVFSGSLTKTGKTIKYIYYYLDDEPDSVAATGQSGYWDFFMLYKGDFTLPNTAYGCNFTPPPRDSDEPAPNRITDIIQGLGGESASFDCSCDLDVGTWKRAADVVDAQVIDELSHELSSTTDFTWLDTGLGRQFKARMRDPVIRQFNNRAVLDLSFKEYSRCDAALYNYIARFGLNL